MGCISCQKDKALLKCGLCESDVCKYCAQILPEGSFSFIPNAPDHLKHSVYCGYCFDGQIADAWNDYQKTMEQARNIQVFLSHQGKETRLIKRKEKPFQVVDCLDHDETLMRLAFQAVKAGFNALVDVDLTSKKVRINGYQTQIWSGRGTPVNITARDQVRDRSIWHNPN
ncbi:MAG: hypothetical protein JNL11_18920 [Bdellovibrionaceae bacterium]|nr:hypothetical protein [Pseudobdellovibrionaceae bacterium]